MDRETFNRFLAAAVNAGGSDIHFKAGNSPALRVNGELVAYKVPALQPEDTEQIAGYILEQLLKQDVTAAGIFEPRSGRLHHPHRFRAGRGLPIEYLLQGGE